MGNGCLCATKNRAWYGISLFFHSAENYLLIMLTDNLRFIVLIINGLMFLFYKNYDRGICFE